MSFVFELKLGDATVKRITFAGKFGRRALKTSSGHTVGELVLTGAGLRLELDDDAAQQIVDSDFH